jgi:hypothetical protein
VKIKFAETPQQWLRQLPGGQRGQAGADLVLQTGKIAEYLRRLQRRVMFGGYPQRRLEQCGRLAVEASETSQARVHGHLL